jgi:hypothetical protein
MTPFWIVPLFVITGVWLVWRGASSVGRWWLLVLVAAIGPVYGLTMGREVGSADVFEFQVTAPALGIAHPTGYPTWLLLGKLWSLLPFGSVAWRVNLGATVYGVLALLLVALIVWRGGRQPLAALTAALLLGLTPTFWQEAVQAEVYTLHALFVAAILLVTLRLPARIATPPDPASRRSLFLLFFLAGLSLTNHLTTVLLAPALLLALVQAGGVRLWRWGAALWARLIGVALLPLLLYLYLPLRWQAVNGEPMGWRRFVEWVTGARFGGALQWDLWLRDGERYRIIGRFLQTEWGLWLIVALIGLAVLLWQRRRREAILLTTVLAAFLFYGLNYTVPDLNVFILPAQMMVALAIGAALSAALARLEQAAPHPLVALLPWLLLPLLALRGSDATWQQVDRSAPNPLLPWATAVLHQPLAPNGVLLADSDKFPPLYYLQQAEGMRPDLLIAVLPDEAAYRAAIDQHLATGRTVYLARYLPRLAQPLRSAGPLAEIVPQRAIAAVAADGLSVGPLRLIDISASEPGAWGAGTVGVTFEWQLVEALSADSLIWLRWQGSDERPLAAHPVNNLYPLAAWQPGEQVSDFWLMPLPALGESADMTLEVAVAPPFSPADTLAWHPVTRLTLPAWSPPAPLVATDRLPVPDGAVNFDDRIALTTVERPDGPLVPGGTLTVTLHWLALAAPDRDYTRFVQVADSSDTLHGQEDSWPLQGTWPTSQWQAGQVVVERVTVPLSADLPDGPLRLYLGWYWLGDMRRLPVLDPTGMPIDDKITVELIIDN